MKTALITGSSNGIGEVIARELSSAGFKVFITGRDEDKLIELAHEISAAYLPCDLLDEASINKFHHAALNELGHVDVLVNNAGAYSWSPVERTEESKIAEILKLNLEIPFRLCKLFVPSMKQKKWGRIINIGSISGIVGEANASLYSCSKAGLIGLTKSLALELAEHGITVNLVNPGWVKTNLTQPIFADGTLNEAEEIEMVPQKRWIEPVEIAALVQYLASDLAGGVTGQSINLCAGLSLG